jgi:hypothetical protein
MLPHYGLQPNAMAGLLFHMETMASDLRSVLHGTVRQWAFQARHPSTTPLWRHELTLLGLRLPRIQNLKPWRQHQVKTLSVQNALTNQWEQRPIHFNTFNIHQPNSKGQFELLMLGDPGYYNATNQYMADAAMAYGQHHNGSKPFQAVLGLGDFLYPNNEQDEPSALLQSGAPQLLWSNIGRPYQAYFKQGIPLLATLGNHEIKGGHGDLFLHYLDTPPYYKVSVGKHLDVFVLDETVWGVNDFMAQNKNSKTTEPMRQAMARRNDQLAWLKAAVAESRAQNPNKKLLIMGHYPLNPIDGTKTAKFVHDRHDALDPIIREFGIDGIIHGHVHQYSYSTYAHTNTRCEGLQPLEKPYFQLGFGSGVHYEAPTGKFSWVADPNTRHERLKHSVVPPTNSDALHLSTGFTTLSVDETTRKLTFRFIQPPCGRNTYYRGQRINPGLMGANEEHPNTFKVLHQVTL